MTAAILTIKAYIQSYYDDVFNKQYFISIVVLMAILISFNYGYALPVTQTWWQSFLYDYLLYFFPFAAAYALQYFYFKDNSGFSNRWFWILLLLAPALFAFRVNFNFHQNFIKAFSSVESFRYISSIVNYIVKVIVLMLPVIFIWLIKDKKYFPLYGFSVHRHRKMYGLLLACMVPLVFAAALLPDFLNTYPKVIRDAGLYSSDSFLQYALFELAYGLDFLSIEFFFRGFLIIAFIKYFGMRSIVPAACFYCCIHFGKPMPEAISSFFGGLLLGIISYHTLSIWGGLLIHLGIAWLMEIAAYISHHF